MNYPEISLRKGSEQLLRRGHPWVYSGAVAGHSPDAAPGEIVDVIDSRGGFVGRGYYNPHSTIAIRVMSRDRNEAIDDAFLTRAIERAPDYVDAYNNRGAAYSGLGQYQRAMQDYDKAIQMWAPKASYYNNRRVAYRKMGKDAEADADKDEACLRDAQYC